MDLARSSLKLFAANIGSAVIQFLGIAYFARILGPSEMGVFFLFQALLGMLAIPADFGLRGAVEKRISQGESRGTFLSSAVLLKLAPIIAIVAAILLFRTLINNYLGANLAILLALAIILQEIAQLSVVVLKGELRVDETAVLQVARHGAWLGVGAALVSQGFGAIALIYGLLAGLSIVFIWGWYKVSVIPSHPSRQHARSLFNYGKHNVVSSLGGYFYSWMDITIIGLFLTQAHVGAYEIAWRVASVVILLSRSIATAIFPQVSEWSANDAHDQIEDLLPEVLTPSLILVIPAFFGTMLLSEEILELVFGTEYTMAALALIILMFDQVTEAGQVVLGRSLQAVNRPDLAARATVIGVVLNLVLNLVLITRFGITGAAVATMVASLISGLILHTLYLSRVISLRIPFRELFGCVLAGVVMSLLLQVVRSIMIIDSIVNLSAIIALGATIYGGALLIFPSTRTKVINHSQSILRGRT
jgi:O-antigen/teichoic acid export membrane protein